MNYGTRAGDVLEIGLTGSTIAVKEPYLGFFGKSDGARVQPKTQKQKRALGQDFIPTNQEGIVKGYG
jgi:hypothetical protein